MAAIATIRPAASDPSKSPESPPPASHRVAPHARSLKPRNHGFPNDARVFQPQREFSRLRREAPSRHSPQVLILLLLTVLKPRKIRHRCHPTLVLHEISEQLFLSHFATAMQFGYNFIKDPIRILLKTELRRRRMIGEIRENQIVVVHRYRSISFSKTPGPAYFSQSERISSLLMLCDTLPSSWRMSSMSRPCLTASSFNA